MDFSDHPFSFSGTSIKFKLMLNIVPYVTAAFIIFFNLCVCVSV